MDSFNIVEEIQKFLLFIGTEAGKMWERLENEKEKRKRSIEITDSRVLSFPYSDKTIKIISPPVQTNVCEKSLPPEENTTDDIKNQPFSNTTEFSSDVDIQTEEKGTFQITQEDLKKMPKTISKGKIYAEGFAVCWRKRKTGKNSYSYNVRFKRFGFNIDFSEKRKEELKARFSEEFKKQALEKEQQTANGIPTTFNCFSMYYFEKVRKKKVVAKTYVTDLNRYNKHLKPVFKERPLKSILPPECQELLDKIVGSGKGKTADDVYSLLNGIFNYAIDNYLLERNPLSPVIHIQHERIHGSALTYEEERLLLESVKNNPRQLVSIAVALYTGLRPNEFKTARIVDKFIIAINSKRKNKKIEYKKIPISPMLQPYLANIDSLDMLGTYQMRDVMKSILPNHKLYDLRTTFYSRCKECGVAESALKEFMGHSLGALGEAYTDLSDEYLLKEGAKLKY